MAGEGYIKLYRSTLSWEWQTEPNTAHLFHTMLMLANHEPNRWRGIQIERGQFVSSYEKLSIATGLSVRNVRTALKNLKTTKEVTVKTTNKYGIYTIENYDKYQSRDGEEGSQVTGKPSVKRQSSDSQVTTNKNEKNEKNEKNILPDWLPVDLWNDYLAMRKQIKSPMSDRAQKIALSKLKKMKEAGHNIQSIMEDAILKNWKSFYEPSNTNRPESPKRQREFI